MDSPWRCLSTRQALALCNEFIEHPGTYGKLNSSVVEWRDVLRRASLALPSSEVDDAVVRSCYRDFGAGERVVVNSEFANVLNLIPGEVVGRSRLRKLVTPIVGPKSFDRMEVFLSDVYSNYFQNRDDRWVVRPRGARFNDLERGVIQELGYEFVGNRACHPSMIGFLGLFTVEVETVYRPGILRSTTARTVWARSSKFNRTETGYFNVPERPLEKRCIWQRESSLCSVSYGLFHPKRPP